MTCLPISLNPLPLQPHFDRLAFASVKLTITMQMSRRHHGGGRGLVRMAKHDGEEADEAQNDR
jgi:hypothetical protein